MNSAAAAYLSSDQEKPASTEICDRFRLDVMKAFQCSDHPTVAHYDDGAVFGRSFETDLAECFGNSLTKQVFVFTAGQLGDIPVAPTGQHSRPCPLDFLGRFSRPLAHAPLTETGDDTYRFGLQRPTDRLGCLFGPPEVRRNDSNRYRPGPLLKIFGSRLGLGVALGSKVDVGPPLPPLLGVPNREAVAQHQNPGGPKSRSGRRSVRLR